MAHPPLAGTQHPPVAGYSWRFGEQGKKNSPSATLVISGGFMLNLVKKPIEQ